MNINKIDAAKINSMSEKAAKAELATAITIIRKTVKDVPEKKRKIETSYNKQGHMRCVNYLKGFLNIWEAKNGS